MYMKVLSEVATKKEKQIINNVRWRKLPSVRTLPKGPDGFGTITALWKEGCSLTTKQPLVAGENVWLKAMDPETGGILISVVGTVIWTDCRFTPEGCRCEIRFRSEGEFMTQVQGEKLGIYVQQSPSSQAAS